MPKNVIQYIQVFIFFKYMYNAQNDSDNKSLEIRATGHLQHFQKLIEIFNLSDFELCQETLDGVT